MHNANDKYPPQAPSAYVELFDNLISPPNETCGPHEESRTGSCTVTAMRKNVAAAVTALDDSIGDLIETLERNNMYDNTIIIFSTDNGGAPIEMFNHNAGTNFPLRGGKVTICIFLSNLAR